MQEQGIDVLCNNAGVMALEDKAISERDHGFDLLQHEFFAHQGGRLSEIREEKGLTAALLLYSTESQRSEFSMEIGCSIEQLELLQRPDLEGKRLLFTHVRA